MEYTCASCSKRFAALFSYVQHAKDTPGHTIPPHKQCSHCAQAFETEAALTMHMLKTHALCPVCGSVFKKRRKLDAHVAIAHPDNTATASSVGVPTSLSPPVASTTSATASRALQEETPRVSLPVTAARSDGYAPSIVASDSQNTVDDRKAQQGEQALRSVSEPSTRSASPVRSSKIPTSSLVGYGFTQSSPSAAVQTGSEDDSEHVSVNPRSSSRPASVMSVSSVASSSLTSESISSTPTLSPKPREPTPLDPPAMWSGESVEPPEGPYTFPQPFHTISTAAATEKAASTVNSTRSPLPHSFQPSRSATPRPGSTPLVDSGGLSWHCRSCYKNPCEDPTATMCGHIFCHGCIIKELATNMHCPACKKVMLLRLDVNS